MTARFYALWLMALSIMGSALVGLTAQAASLQISPLLLEVKPGSNVATYTLRNGSEQELGVQISAYQWAQKSNRDTLQPADELMLVPAIVVIPPGKEQLVRVALRSQRSPTELSYRLHFQELPSQSHTGAVAVQTLLKIDVPLFFSAKEANNAYRPRLMAGDQASEMLVELTNTGTRFLRLSQLDLFDSNGKHLSQLRGPLYVLPGATRRWALTLEGAHQKTKNAKGEKPTYRLEVKSGRTSDRHVLEVR